MGKKYDDKDLAKLISDVDSAFREKINMVKSEQAKKEKENKDQTNDLKKSEEAPTDVSSDLDYDESDYADMDELYSSMSKSEAAAHLKSLSKFVADEQPMAKSEKSSTEEDDMMKSELSGVKNELEAARKVNEEMKKNMETMSKIVSKIIQPAAPQRKAVTSLEYIKKSEDENSSSEESKTSKDFSKLSKSEISSILSAKIRTGKLEKKDRELVTEYYDDNISVEQIKHIL